jgi:hypothetical protein
MQNAPAGAGVYGLTNARGWIFIGESDDIRASLLARLERKFAGVDGRAATGFFFESWPTGDCTARRDRLIQELGPRYKAGTLERGAGGRR